jgi:hypothetical protein
MDNTSRVTTQDKIAQRGDSQAKIAHTIADAVLVASLSRSMLYLAIGRGALRARKCGARTLILDADLRRFLRSLPSFRKAQSKPEAAA